MRATATPTCSGGTLDLRMALCGVGLICSTSDSVLRASRVAPTQWVGCGCGAMAARSDALQHAAVAATGSLDIALQRFGATAGMAEFVADAIEARLHGVL
jgi:hypothetical protein